MLCYYHTKKERKKKREAERSVETFGGDGYVYGIDCGDGLTIVYVSPGSSSCIL